MSTAKVTAGVLGGFLVAVAGTMCVALYLPTPERDRMLTAGLSFIPLWVTALCVAGMSPSGRRAWAWNGSWFSIMAILAVGRLLLG